jgi:hypothetical protein
VRSIGLEMYGMQPKRQVASVSATTGRTERDPLAGTVDRELGAVLSALEKMRTKLERARVRETARNPTGEDATDVRPTSSESRALGVT